MSFKPQKAYILYHDNPISRDYAMGCAKSIESIGMPYEFFEGYSKLDNYSVWEQLGLFLPRGPKHQANSQKANAVCCTSSHYNIWKTMIERGDECAVILEHDAYMLHKVDIDIPDNHLVALGYRIQKLSDYNHNAAGPPREIVSVDKHSGTHAYAININTASSLVNQLRAGDKPRGCIDQHLFNAHKLKRQLECEISITDPISAVALVRKSTIQNKSATSNGFRIISFMENYSGSQESIYY